MSDQTPTFTMSRDLDAPRALVFKCFTDPARMQKWWGPKGFTVVRSDMDLRVGGTYLYGMKSPDGHAMWGRFVFREVDPPKKLVFLNSFSDEHGGVTRHPMSPKWPLELLSVFTFEELPGNRTRFTLSWSPWQASEEERAVFDAARDSMTGGWGGTLEQLVAYLATQTKGPGA